MLSGLLILLLSGLVLLWLVLTLHTAWLLTHPPRRTYAWAVARALPGDPSELVLPGGGAGTVSATAEFREFVVTVLGARLPGWDIAGGNPAGPTIILSHGWGDSRVVMLSRVPALWPLTSRLILCDSRGHGDASGSCSLGTREVADLLAVINHARDTAAGPSPIILYGHSLGAGASIAAAAIDGRIASVVAEAPYRVPTTPAHNVLASRSLPYRATLAPALAIVGLARAGTLRWALPGDAAGFDRALHAARLPASTLLLVLSGTADTICPPADARDIARAGRGCLREIEHATHTGMWTDPDTSGACVDAISAFLAHAAAPPPCPANHAPCPTPSTTPAA